MKVSDILERAADLIEPEGRWARGGFSFRNGLSVGWQGRDADCWCALGAIGDVSRGDLRLCSESRPVAFFTEHLGYLDWSDATQWNDAPERTQAEVVAKLREAAAKAREQGQ